MAEFEFYALQGDRRTNALNLESRLKRRFKKGTRRHLVIPEGGRLVEMHPDDAQNRRTFNATHEYLNGSLTEVSNGH